MKTGRNPTLFERIRMTAEEKLEDRKSRKEERKCDSREEKVPVASEGGNASPSVKKDRSGKELRHATLMLLKGWDPAYEVDPKEPFRYMDWSYVLVKSGNRFVGFYSADSDCDSTDSLDFYDPQKAGHRRIWGYYRAGATTSETDIRKAIKQDLLEMGYDADVENAIHPECFDCCSERYSCRYEKCPAESESFL